MDGGGQSAQCWTGTARVFRPCIRLFVPNPLKRKNFFCDCGIPGLFAIYLLTDRDLSQVSNYQNYNFVINFIILIFVPYESDSNIHVKRVLGEASR